MGIITVIAVLISGTAFSACGEHSHEWDEGKITVEATCESEGVKTFSCTVKGCKETRTESVGKTAHTWDGGSITKEPSCTDEGTVTFTCGVCGETRAEPVVKTAHTYGEGSLTLIPALTVGGEMTYSCTYCGNIKKEKLLPATISAKISIRALRILPYGSTAMPKGLTPKRADLPLNASFRPTKNSPRYGKPRA